MTKTKNKVKKTGGRGVSQFQAKKVKPKPGGCIYRHSKTGGYYWKVRKKGEEKYSYIPLVAKGKEYATKSKAHAENIRRDLWDEWYPGSLSVPRSMNQWAEDFRQWNLNTASALQVAFNVRIVGDFLSLVGIEKPWQILPEHVEQYLAALRKTKRAERTILHHRNALSKFCQFLLLREVLERNPARLVEVRVPRQRPPRYLDDEHIRDFTEALQDGPGWLRRACLIGLYQGPRKAEIRQLRTQDIYKETMMIGGATPTKTGDYRTVPIFPEVAELLKELRIRRVHPKVGMSTSQGRNRQKMPLSDWTRSQPEAFLFPQEPLWWWGDQLRELTEDLPVFGELPGRSTGNQWHLLRSTFTVLRARQGATLWELMAWLGHKNPTTTMRYLNIAHAAGMVAPDQQRPWDHA